MRVGPKSSGFTIIETMIVLAVTAALFLLAAKAVGGMQNEGEFQQAINGTQSSIEQIVNQVATGDFSTSSKFSCSDQGTGVPVISSSAATEGTSDGCILLGKVVQFGVQANSQNQPYSVLPIAGLRNNNGSLATAAPVAIAPGTNTNNASGFPNAAEPGYLQSGLTVASMDYLSGSSCSTLTPVGAVGFIYGLSTSDDPGQQLSGSRQINMYPISGTSLGETTNDAVDQINDYQGDANTGLVSSPENPCGGVQICFASGTSDQSGLIVIGGNGGSVDSVTTTIFNGKTCT